MLDRLRTRAETVEGRSYPRYAPNVSHDVTVSTGFRGATPKLPQGPPHRDERLDLVLVRDSADRADVVLVDAEQCRQAGADAEG